MLSRRRVTVILGASLAAVASFGAGLLLRRSQVEGDGEDGIGRDAGPLFAVALPDADGREQKLEQWKGKVVLVNFWATWCVPCRAEMPEFVRVQRDLAPRGLQIVGIAIDTPDKVVPFVTELGINYPILIGGYGALELSKAFGNRLVALPFTLVLSREGKVANVQLGQLSEDRLRSIVGALL